MQKRDADKTSNHSLVERMICQNDAVQVRMRGVVGDKQEYCAIHVTWNNFFKMNDMLDGVDPCLEVEFCENDEEGYIWWHWVLKESEDATYLNAVDAGTINEGEWVVLGNHGFIASMDGELFEERFEIVNDPDVVES